jgi:hypothetical protein
MARIVKAMGEGVVCMVMMRMFSHFWELAQLRGFVGSLALSQVCYSKLATVCCTHLVNIPLLLMRHDRLPAHSVRWFRETS